MPRRITQSIAYLLPGSAPRRVARANRRALRGIQFALTLILASVAIASCKGTAQSPAAARSYQRTQQPVLQGPRQSQRPRGNRDAATSASGSTQNIRVNIGFRSRSQFNEHFAKHGPEFGQVTQEEYLREAQTLRDAPAGGNVEEIRRSDGTVSRYDRASGAFIAFNADGTIRTFFKPNNGEAYFRRQATRSH